MGGRTTKHGEWLIDTAALRISGLNGASAVQLFDVVRAVIEPDGGAARAGAVDTAPEGIVFVIHGPAAGEAYLRETIFEVPGVGRALSRIGQGVAVIVVGVSAARSAGEMVRAVDGVARYVHRCGTVADHVVGISFGCGLSAADRLLHLANNLPKIF